MLVRISKSHYKYVKSTGPGGKSKSIIHPEDFIGISRECNGFIFPPVSVVRTSFTFAGRIIGFASACNCFGMYVYTFPKEGRRKLKL